MISKNSLLWRALALNAAFSSVSALLMLIFADWIAQQLNLAQSLSVTITAGLLLVFALQLWNIVRTRQVRTWEIVSIIVGDLAWVAGSFVLVGIYYNSVSTLGLILVDLVALAVFSFAIMQIRGLRQLV
jgi:hypothetical protein